MRLRYTFLLQKSMCLHILCVFAWSFISQAQTAFANVPLPLIEPRNAAGKALMLPKLSDVKVGISNSYKPGSVATVQLRFDVEKTYDWVITLLAEDADGQSTKLRKTTPLYRYVPWYPHYQTVAFELQTSRKPQRLIIQLSLSPQNRHNPELKDHEDDKEANIVQYEGPDLPVDVEFHWNGSDSNSIPSTKEIWLEIGPSIKLKNLAVAFTKEESLQPWVVQVPGLMELLLKDNTYHGFKGITISSPIRFSTGEWPRYVFEYQVGRIADWVKSGGNLLLVLHDDPENTSPHSSFQKIWNQVLPGKLQAKTKTHSNFPLWETFLGTDEPLVINEQLRRNPPLIPVLENIKGKVLLADGDTPLVIEHQLGLGRVVTCLVDLNAEPWRNWKKRDELLQRLIPWHITTDAEAKFASSSSSQRLGYDDMAGQFVTALGTFPSVRQTPFWVLMGAALVFGVVWYYIQSTLLKTWSVTARLVIAAFLLIASTVGFAALVGAFNGNAKLLANSAQVVDYNATQGEYQGQSWLSVMSNNARKINLEASVTTTGKDQPDQQLEWLGLPGKGWGGLDAPLATWTQGGEPYQIDSYGAGVHGLTLSPDLTKSFHERWRQPIAAAPPDPLVSHPGESLPRGVLKTELPFALKDAILLYNNWGVELGTVQPGQVIDLDQVRGRVASAATIITGKRVKPTEAAQSYDRANTDVAQILRLMLLYRAAGGTRYTGLFSRAWPLLDQSSSLTENQALILGRGPAPVKWKVGPAGEPLQPLESASEVCWYRLWLPVIPSDQANVNVSGPTMIRLPK